MMRNSPKWIIIDTDTLNQYLEHEKIFNQVGVPCTLFVVYLVDDDVSIGQINVSTSLGVLTREMHVRSEPEESRRDWPPSLVITTVRSLYQTEEGEQSNSCKKHEKPYPEAKPYSPCRMMVPFLPYTFPSSAWSPELQLVRQLSGFPESVIA